MTTSDSSEDNQCPAQGLLKTLSGKWKPEIFRSAAKGPVRFSILLKTLAGCNKQAISTALKELEDAQLLQRIIIKKKPLHIEYKLSEKGRSLIPIFLQLENLITDHNDH